MLQQKMARAGLAVLGLASGMGFLGANEASAKGCNGVVDQMKWGCAAWDNNNGPQFPHYKKPAAPAAVVTPSQAQRPVIAPNGGSGIVASGGGNAVSKSGSGIVASGGGNAVQK
jgi:hypothetical protein